jgi:hypothetical protein
MVVHSAMVTSSSGRILFSKFYGENRPQASEEFEALLVQELQRYFENQNDHSRKSATIGDTHVVFQDFGTLIIYLTGREESDEIYCT